MNNLIQGLFGEGLDSEPFFGEKDYESFRERFVEIMFPFLEEQRTRRAESEKASMSHYVD